MKAILIPISILLALLLGGCGGSQKAVGEPVSEAETVPAAVDTIPSTPDTVVVALPYEPDRPEVVMSLARTSCYGRCPVYSIKLYSDRSVVYHGRRYVDRIGFYGGDLSEDRFEEIFDYADNIGYFDYANKYPEDGRLIGDLPNTVIGLSKDGEWKEILINHRAPPELVEFTDWLDKLFESIELKILPDSSDNQEN